MLKTNSQFKQGFTIVELLIVVVVIAILAAITIVSYNGITFKATESTLQSDLRTMATQLSVSSQTDGSYPATLPSDIRTSDDNAAIYQGDGNTFCLSLTSKKHTSLSFYTTQDGSIQSGTCATVATQISVGGQHTLVLGSDGKVYAWGNNASGQLGDNTSSTRASPIPASDYGSLTGKKVTQISAASDASFALDSDGTVHAWGFNNSYQLGDGTTTLKRTPIIVNGGSLAGKTVVAISAGAMHVLALASDGTLHAWGYNGFGSIGNSSTTSQPLPIAINSFGSIAGKTITKIFGSNTNSYALASDGTLHAWGMNTDGQIGNGAATTQETRAVQISSVGSLAGKTVTTLGRGAVSRHMIAIASDGTIHAWGKNTNSQLGNGSSTLSRSPINIGSQGSLSGTTAASAGLGAEFSIVSTSNGATHTWGLNSSSQLGNGATSTATTPIAINTSGALNGVTISSVGAGTAHAVALGSDGKLYAWGINNFGQVGDATTVTRTTPVTVTLP